MDIRLVQDLAWSDDMQNLACGVGAFYPKYHWRLWTRCRACPAWERDRRQVSIQGPRASGREDRLRRLESQPTGTEYVRLV